MEEGELKLSKRIDLKSANSSGRLDADPQMHLATLTMLNPDVLFSTVEEILPEARRLNMSFKK